MRHQIFATRGKPISASITSALVALLVIAAPGRVFAQIGPTQNKHVRYVVIDTGTLGGPSSFLGFEQSRNINNRGMLAAATDTAIPTTQPFCLGDCFISDVTIWQDGRLFDLGTIPGPGGGTAWISDSGLVAGLAMNGQLDPVTGIAELEPVLWKDGGPINLGTFGGTQGIAGGVNDLGQVVGCATNLIPDSFSTCMGVPQATQSRAFLWQNGRMLDLGTLGGTDANALIINDRGQVTGWSFTNDTPNPATGIPTLHPFFWQAGKMIDIGTLGGTVATPFWLNNSSQVVGQSNLVGDVFSHPFLWQSGKLKDLGTLGGNFGSAISVSEAGEVVGWSTTPGDQTVHAFRWTHAGMRDLGVLPGKLCSLAYAVNSIGQIVGDADTDCNQGNASAFLWENGSLIDLNTFASPESGVHLTFALSINERGEVAALGLLPNSDQHAFLVIPCDENHPGIGDCDYSLIETSATPASGSMQTAQRSAPGNPGIPALASTQSNLWSKNSNGLRWHNLRFPRFSSNRFR
jgi:probable HAF family extracellular repeat protein